jgi:hypothetical protein
VIERLLDPLAFYFLSIFILRFASSSALLITLIDFV